MGYRPFRTRYSVDTPATVATFATVGAETPRSVATVASVARVFPFSAFDADDWRAAFEERAAIMEYDGGLSREDAERLARDEIDGLRWGA